MDSLQRNQQFFFSLVCAIFMWISGMYTGLHWTNKTDMRPYRDHFFRENATVSVPCVQMTTLSCPSQIAVAWDVGRFGNRFFQYLIARLTSNVLGNEIFITRNFADMYDQLFIGRKTRIVDWSHLKYECGIQESSCTKMYVNYLPELQPISNETFRCIHFTGTERKFRGPKVKKKKF